jgi:hypothetical protein
MKNLFRTLGASILLVPLAAGCSQSDQAAQGPADNGVQNGYLLAEEPQGATGVTEARQASADEVTVVGRVGGSPDPFVEGMAAFTIVDPEIPSCAAEEDCPTPWDYCCQLDRVKNGIAMVKVVDAQGKPVATDARELLGVKGLSTVVVRGDAQRDDQGNLTVLAEKVYVRSP